MTKRYSRRDALLTGAALLTLPGLSLLAKEISGRIMRVSAPARLRTPV